MRTYRDSLLSGIKIKSLSRLKEIIKREKAKGKVIVFTNGCFDILHSGHIRYLEEAKGKGDILIVGLNSDSSVRRIKGKKRPIVVEKDRARVIAGLNSVDYVFIFPEDTPLKAIKILRPDVLVKGADWQRDKIVGGSLLLSYGGRVERIRLAAKRSTTNLIKKIVRLYQVKKRH